MMRNQFMELKSPANVRLTRRNALARGAIVALGATVPHQPEFAPAAEVDEAAVNDAPIFNEYRYGHMLQEYYVRRLRRIWRRRADLRAAIETPEQVMTLRDDVRRKLKACYGPWPARTPLKERITGKVEREHYIIEKLIYESRPDYLVTGNVYVPKGRPGRLPAVLGTCGHSNNGKASGSLSRVRQESRPSGLRRSHFRSACPGGAK